MHKSRHFASTLVTVLLIDRTKWSINKRTYQRYSKQTQLFIHSHTHQTKPNQKHSQLIPKRSLIDVADNRASAENERVERAPRLHPRLSIVARTPLLNKLCPTVQDPPRVLHHRCSISLSLPLVAASAHLRPNVRSKEQLSLRQPAKLRGGERASAHCHNHVQ